MKLATASDPSALRLPLRSAQGYGLGQAGSGQALSALIARVAGLLAERGAEAYVVGGYVRDLLLGRESHDVDIALAGDDPLEAGRALADTLGGHFFILDAERRFARALVPLSAVPTPIVLDLSPLVGTLEQDLARRDFTLDAMALPLALATEREALVDPWGGREDLAQRRVRAVSADTLREDPARLLRAVRLAGELDFRIEEGTAKLVARQARELQRVSPERVRDELCRVLALGRARPWLAELDRLGLLTVVLPELEASRGVAQPREHHWDVFTHLLETVGAFERMLDPQERLTDPVLSRLPWDPSVDAYFAEGVASGRTRGVLTKLACLLHDVAKPQTKAFEPSGRMRFFGHAEEGAEMARGALERLRFSRREIAFVGVAVEQHLRPAQLSQELEPPTRRALYRYYRDLDDAALATLYLSLADYLAARGPRLEPEDWARHAAYAALVLAAAHGPAEGETPQPRLLDGRLLMERLGLPPGPLVGRLLDAVEEAVGAGEVTTTEEALALARRALGEGGEHPVAERES